MKPIRKMVLSLAIGAVLGLALNWVGWFPRPSFWTGHRNRFDFDVEWNRVLPSIALWVLFSVYWSIAARSSSRTERSESKISTAFHQVLLNVAMVLLFWEAPGLTEWFLPQRFHFLVAIGVTIQACSLALAVWARRHLGHNWSGEVRVAVGHELVRTGPYRWVRHPIYTGMLGMFLGTAIASSQLHALVGVLMLTVAYMRKTRLEERILTETFGADYAAYQRDTWALAPPLY